MLLLGATRAEATTYAVSLFDGLDGVAVGGSITTDGTVGFLNASNIIDWNLIGTVQNINLTTLFDLTGPLSGNNSDIQNILNIEATATTLFLDFPFGDLLFETSTSSLHTTLEFHATEPKDATSPIQAVTICEVFSGTCSVGSFSSLVIGDGKVIETTATTPIPAALPLFATGLGALGLLGWRRKRKAQAVA